MVNGEFLGNPFSTFSPNKAHVENPHDIPEAPEQIHILLDSKPAWVRVDDAGSEDRYERYPSESLEDWHRRHGLLAAD